MITSESEVTAYPLKTIRFVHERNVLVWTIGLSDISQSKFDYDLNFDDIVLFVCV